MKKLIRCLLKDNKNMYSYGLLLLRAAIGLIFIPMGLIKAMKGEEEILWLGKQLSVLGIHFWPYFFGICAVIAELVGGICLTLGLFTRLFGLMMSFTMFVAMLHHIDKGDSYGYWAFPLICLIVFLVFVIVGGTRYSLDHKIAKSLHTKALDS